MTGVGLGQLLLALDATLVSLVEAPRGLDLPVASAALIDSDDVRLGLATAAGSADVFFLLGVTDDEAWTWIRHRRAPVAIFAKEPSQALVTRAVAVGSAVVAVEPRARWERLYQLVNHVLEHHGQGDPVDDSGTDLFGLAQSLADRIHGMVSIEDAQSQVLAYSASNDEADELRRLSILGRAGPPEHLEWIGQWGIFDALRADNEVVRVAERPELGLRPRLAIGIYHPSTGPRRPPVFPARSGCSRGRSPWPTMPSRCCAAPQCWPPGSCLGGGPAVDAFAQGATTARPDRRRPGRTARHRPRTRAGADANATLIGFDTADHHPRLADVLALSASAFRATPRSRRTVHESMCCCRRPRRPVGRPRGPAARSARCAPSSVCDCARSLPHRSRDWPTGCRGARRGRPGARQR